MIKICADKSYKLSKPTTEVHSLFLILQTAKKHMYLVEQDQRIVQLVEDFDRRHTGNEYTAKKGNSSAVTAAQLPAVRFYYFTLK